MINENSDPETNEEINISQEKDRKISQEKDGKTEIELKEYFDLALRRAQEIREKYSDLIYEEKDVEDK